MTFPVLRPAVLDDAELAADLMTASYPPEPTDPILTRYRWEHPPDAWTTGRYIAELDGVPVAFVTWSHPEWDRDKQRHCAIDVWYLPILDGDLIAWLVRWIEQRSIEEGARNLTAYAAEDESSYMTVLARLGYERDRQEMVRELDLMKHGERLLAEAAVAREEAAKNGIEMTTLAAWSDPDKMRKLHALSEATNQDMPHTLPIVPQSFENFVERMSAPDVHFDRMWVAVDGSRTVAWSYLRFPPVRGNIWTAYTCCHPDYRGRGLARAVKLQSLAQAADLGIPAVRTSNDGENAAMIHINQALGYTLRPGFVGHLKRVQE